MLQVVPKGAVTSSTFRPKKSFATCWKVRLRQRRRKRISRLFVSLVAYCNFRKINLSIFPAELGSTQTAATRGKLKAFIRPRGAPDRSRRGWLRRISWWRSGPARAGLREADYEPTDRETVITALLESQQGGPLISRISTAAKDCGIRLVKTKTPNIRNALVPAIDLMTISLLSRVS